MFIYASEASRGAKLAQLQANLRLCEKIVDYSTWKFELGGEFENAGYSVSAIKKMCALLKALPKDFEVTANIVMILCCNYNEAVSKLMMREA